MRITFLAPGYVWGPSGGMRVVYEYANRLSARGHDISVVHPRRLRYSPSCPEPSLAVWVREWAKRELRRLKPKPQVTWQPICDRVQMLSVPDSSSRYIPDGDVIFATSWHTVRSVQECPNSKGKKCYLIQGYESYHAANELVDATWRAPLHKVVVAKWLAGLGSELGCEEVTYIPNGINHELYRLIHPIERRSRQIAMAFSTAQVKGAADGIEALRLVRQRHPDVKVILFGVSRRQSWLPTWAEYHRNPPQDFIVNEIYNRSQVFVSSSWMEGFALPPAEAGACGCAVVATDSLGVREFITNGVTGLLSPPKDPRALAENVSLILENEPLRVQLAKACNQIIGRLDWERSASLLEDFVRGLGAVKDGGAGRRSLVLPLGESAQ